MWFLLLVVLMTFGGLIGAYIVISTNGAMEWKTFRTAGFQIWIQHGFNSASSITYQSLAKNFLFDEKQQQAKTGCWQRPFWARMFISSQILAWLALVRRGVYVESNPYAGFFYILTAVHAVHVLGGIMRARLHRFADVVSNKSRSGISLNAQKFRRTSSAGIGICMDGLWLVLVFTARFLEIKYGWTTLPDTKINENRNF